MILKQQNPSKKLRPLASAPCRKPKPFAPQPSGTHRPGEPPQADSLQWRHAKSIQHLEEQAIQEEGKSQLDFLFACQAAIQASPVELCGMLVASYHILMGQAPMAPPIYPCTRSLSYWASTCPSGSFSNTWAFTPTQVTTPLPRPSGHHTFWWDHVQGNPRRAP